MCCEKELSFTPSLMLVLDLVLDFCENNDKDYEEYYVDLDLIRLEYAHDLPSNDLDMVTQIANLSNSGTLNPETALQHISWIKNAHEYVKGMEKWNESVDKRKAVVNNSKVVNDTNLERQNSNVITNGDRDNARNNAKGVSTKISDNKVTL